MAVRACVYLRLARWARARAFQHQTIRVFWSENDAQPERAQSISTLTLPDIYKSRVACVYNTDGKC
eukprot:1112972-Pelagomonas_calceolata.AAC.1